MRTFFTVLLLPLLLSTLSAQDISGNWYTILDAMGTKLPLGLEIKAEGGAYAGAMKSPSQTKVKIPLTSVTFDGKKFTAKEAQTGVTIDGVLNGKELRGIFNQANQDFPVIFTRHRPQAYPIEEGPITITARPQDPVDFPYERSAVNFPGGADGVVIAGELTMPAKGKPKAAIVLVSGSGPQDRNAYLGSQINHSPFLVLSDYLTRKGYAVLRYDDRGVGESTGEFRSATSDDFALDATAAVAYLRSLKELKKVPIGVAGHSEGGMIAPVVASRDEELDFVILMAAPAVSIDSLMLEQRRQVGLSMGQPEMLIRRDEPTLRAAYAWIKDNPDLSQEDYVEGLYGVFEEQLKNLPPALQKSIVDPRAFNAQYVKPLSSPWMRRFIAFEPKDFLSQLSIPVLAINGLLDTQVDGMTNLNAIAETMAINGNKDVTITPLLGLNHLFQPAETGSPTEYGTIEVTFDPTALEAIGRWLDERY
ncbi:alpha/beta fold hydrolase [Neolewinella aurantiaca]|uniref:Alpha/beta fold hydrolase n=1 Tax=Neolewinella aurantiaca TaxID=2602767 RepID=A0A5C7FGS7_9BACT|nr:alpha/beta fold hydrolase [Neolewinella aurantiaca]TXF88925.1 alpha/beta fold hydrolase [Neolewinella aurantiaca]